MQLDFVDLAEVGMRATWRLGVLAALTHAVVLAGCAPTIPAYPQTSLGEVPAALSVVQPCGLVQLEVTESLSDGARGWFRGPWKQVYSVFVLRLPGKLVLIDAGLGEATPDDVDQAPWWFRLALGNAARPAKGLATVLRQAGFRPEDVTHVLLTHAHWDHAGGLRDVPQARVVMAPADADWILRESANFVEGAMPLQFAGVAPRIERLAFKGPPMLGFAASQDVFGDGAVVAVPTPGHTRGSTSYLVQSGDGRRWLFVGDAAWVKEGFAEPALKGRVASLVVDHDRDEAADTLGRLHAAYLAKQARIVTAHDERTWIDLPRCASASGR